MNTIDKRPPDADGMARLRQWMAESAGNDPLTDVLHNPGLRVMALADGAARAFDLYASEEAEESGAVPGWLLDVAREICAMSEAFIERVGAWMECNVGDYTHRENAAVDAADLARAAQFHFFISRDDYAAEWIAELAHYYVG